MRASLDQWSELAREIQLNHRKTQVRQELGPSVDTKMANHKEWSELARGVNPRPPRASLDQIWSELARLWSELARSGPNWLGPNWLALTRIHKKYKDLANVDLWLATN